MISKGQFQFKSFFLVLSICFYGLQLLQGQSKWPNENKFTKPWTRWWWMGSAVDHQNIKSQLIAFQKAGLGGVEITPIYGVKGHEENSIPFLSRDYIEMLNFTLKTADSLGMGVDMVLGTGWPYGGAHVDTTHAATKLISRKYILEKDHKIDEIIMPESNESYYKLVAISAFNTDGVYSDLTPHWDKQTQKLDWTAKESACTVYAIFEGKTGQKVKRAAPGGEGFTLDHYSREALHHYLEPYQKVFTQMNHNLRAIFNDSYEVYGTDFTPNFLQEFEERRGYDLRTQLDKLFLQENQEIANRVKCDFRETISDLLLEEFNQPWTDWANENQMKTKLQAHGSPGNLIDLYASADIPECETFGSMPFDIQGLRRELNDIRTGDADPVMLKFSSSAGHIAGKPMISSESFTWLREHFKTALSQTKPEAEELLLNGVNHMFLHGTTYSPEHAGWPGWKFYASVNFHPNNTIWHDAQGLFSYLSRVQSFMQMGKPANENLVYWPLYDIWNSYHDGSLFVPLKIHSLDEWLTPTSFYQLATSLKSEGYDMDFLSDRFLKQAVVLNGQIILPGGEYKSLIIPKCDFMPLETLEQLFRLKSQGANVIFEDLPKSVPGYGSYELRMNQFNELINQLEPADHVSTALKSANVLPESLVDSGLKFIKRKTSRSDIYFIVNHTAVSIKKFIPLNTTFSTVNIFDPLTGKSGYAVTREVGEKTEVLVHLESGEALILEGANLPLNMPWLYFEEDFEQAFALHEAKLSFKQGGPVLPKTYHIKALGSWTNLSKDAENFSGQAEYEFIFDNPYPQVEYWKIDFGDVRESARVWLNDEYLGIIWASPFLLKTNKMKNGKNVLRVEVTNLSANRLRAKERRGEEWKIFYDINMVDKDYKPFDATEWYPMPSGLMDTVKIIPLKLLRPNSY